MRVIAALGICAALLGCGPNRDCESGTVLVSLGFDAATQAATAVKVDVSIDGAPAMSSTVQHSETSGWKLKIEFPHGYPAGSDLRVVVTALEGEVSLGTGSGEGRLTSSCLALSVDVTGATPDGGGTSDGGIRLRGGIGTLGPRSSPAAPMRLRDDGLEVGGRICNGSICAKGGIVP